MPLKQLFLYTFLFSFTTSFGQQADKILTGTEALRIEDYLSSDAMRGRKTGSPEIDQAADFISNEFKNDGLKFLPGLNSYKQSFSNIRTKTTKAIGQVDGSDVDAANIMAITTDSVLMLRENSGYEKYVINNTDTLLNKAADIIGKKKNAIVFVNSSFSSDFKKLGRLKRAEERMNFSVIFILSNAEGTTYHFEIASAVTELKMTNVVAVLPGKSKKDEFVVFSGHYDHLGVGKPNAAGDSIYNGANDDAAGTTAVLMLAEYFAKLHNNERTLIFVTFTAEEIGEFGSQYFSKHIDADKVAAMFNLEMIGTESKWGKNSAYITGYDRSDFGKILQKNLEGTAFHFEPDPYTSQNLFYRSDNATLAALGVPAHTISTSKMDNEPNYHKLSDEISTLDIDNMTEVVKAIALSSKTIISGADTPTRVEKKN